MNENKVQQQQSKQETAAKSLFTFKSRCLDVNFDLDGTDYKPIENIGTGAYGVVCSAINKKSGIKVAIKKIPNAFCEETIAKRTYREIRILRHFRHENIIAIREILNIKGSVSEFKDVYVVLDLMESDLHQIIHSKQAFSEEHVRYFLYQLLRGLKYIHSANVIHRDLKPSNLLVNGNCELKIGDFGMARGVSSVHDHKRQMRMTNYVATRWYRAPELLFPMEHYMKSVDMWSVGCILAEMIGRKQIFPGKNLIDQLTLVTQVLGLPPDKMLRSCHSEQIFNFFHKNYGHMKPIDFKTKYPETDSQALDLLSKMLKYSPEDRVTSAEALKHPYLAKYHDPLDEPLCFPQFDFSFENEKMDTEQIQEKVVKIIHKYHRHKKPALKVPLGSFMKPTPRVCGSASSQKVSSTLLPSQFIPDAPEKQQNTSEALAQSLIQNKTDKQGGGTLVAPQINIQNTAHDSVPAIINCEERKMGLLVATQQSVTDVEMKSASSACGSGRISNQEIVSNGPSKHSLQPQESRDVIMRSASREDLIQELPQGGKLHKLNAKAMSNDVPMKSAKDDSADAGKKAVVEGSQSNSEASQKTISTDTKALIKAALLNAAFRNKMKGSTLDTSKSNLKPAPIGGRKMSVKAWERQKEREDKRKLKLKKATERQKKQKAKTKAQENHGLFLTQEDRDMLERWNKMRATAQEVNETGSIKQWKSEPNIQNSIKTIHQSQGNVPNPVIPSGNPVAQRFENNKDTNRPTTFVLAGRNQSQTGQPVQIKVTQPTTFIIKNTANLAPNTRVGVHQTLKPIAPKKQPCAANQSMITHQGTDLFNQVPVAPSNVNLPVSNQHLSNLQDQKQVYSATDMLNDLTSSSVPLKEPLKSPQRHYPAACHSPPLFVQHGSPPTYEEALEAKQKPPTKMSPLLRDEFLMANHSFGASAIRVAAPDLFKDAIPPAGFYKDPNSPPDIAFVTHQFSKSGMVDVLPPILQLTPRGDGAGYGLTMDLEELLNQSLDMHPPVSAGKCESGPLSASLLSDWLELHNLNQSDLHAVQQELGLSSPFTMSTLPGISHPTAKDK